MPVPSEWDVEVYRDGKRSETLRVIKYEYNKATQHYDLQRVDLASCPGAHCICPNCRRAREEARMAAKAPLGKRVAEGPSYVAVVLAGHTKIKVLGLFVSLMDALAFVKANYRCEPLGKTKFVTKDGEVLMVQAGVHILTMEEA